MHIHFTNKSLNIKDSLCLTLRLAQNNAGTHWKLPLSRMDKNYVHSFMCTFPGQTLINHQYPVDFYYLPQCEEAIQQGLQTGKNWIDFIARNHGNAFNKTMVPI